MAAHVPINTTAMFHIILFWQSIAQKQKQHIKLPDPETSIQLKV